MYIATIMVTEVPDGDVEESKLVKQLSEVGKPSLLMAAQFKGDEKPDSKMIMGSLTEMMNDLAKRLAGNRMKGIIEKILEEGFIDKVFDEEAKRRATKEAQGEAKH